MLFTSCDKNKNGSLDKQELYEAMKKIGLNPTIGELNDFFYMIDKVMILTY